jgi:hypothetical protein
MLTRVRIIKLRELDWESPVPHTQQLQLTPFSIYGRYSCKQLAMLWVQKSSLPAVTEISITLQT